jgi:hypothetical protein
VRVRSLAATGLVVLSLATPASALAATRAPALRSLVWTAGTSSNGQRTVIVGAELPASTRLPATIVIPVPPGVTPEWVGEIVSTDPSKDPTATYTIEQADGYGIMTITVKTARLAQAEFFDAAPKPGTDVVFSASVPVLGAIEEATLAFEPPSGSTVTTASPGLVKTAFGGGDSYAIVKKSPAVGSTLDGSLTANGGASTGAVAQSGQAAPAASGGSTSSLGANPAATLVAALLVAVAGFGLYGAWANRSKIAGLMKGSTDGPEAPPKTEPPVAARKRRSGGSSTRSAVKPAPAEKPSPVPEPEEEEDVEPEDDPAAGSGRVDVATEVERPAPPVATASALPVGHELVVMLKELAAFRTEGLLESDEFTEAKKSLLVGDVRVVTLLKEVIGFHDSGLLTSDEFAIVKQHLLTGSDEIVAEIEDLAALNAEGLLTREEFRTVVDRLLVA